jgi:predicted nuclease of predicted toxin-antitoxin system
MGNMRFLADENFNGMLYKTLLKAIPDLDILRVQDTVMYQAPDSELLAWAAQEERILLTHDVQTVTYFAYERVRAGLPMPGVIEVRISKTIGDIADELALMIQASSPDEFINQVRYIPLR